MSTQVTTNWYEYEGRDGKVSCDGTFYWAHYDEVEGPERFGTLAGAKRFLQERYFWNGGWRQIVKDEVEHLRQTRSQN